MENFSILEKILIGRVDPHIYAFTTNTIPNYLKIGDTYRPVPMRLNEWKKYYPELKEEYRGKAKLNDEVFFRDYAVHKFIEEELGKIRLIENELDNEVYFSNEFFKDASAEDIENAIIDIKKNYEENTGKYQYYNAEDLLPVEHHYASTGTWDLRPNQETAVKNFQNAVKNGRTNLLMYAVMRFGKSFTSLMCAKEMNAKVVIIVSAKADVKEEWKKTVESADNFNDYSFITSEELMGERNIISDYLNSNKKVVVFLTLQDLQGEIIKEKHQDIFKNNIDLLIIDETHFGVRAEKYGQVLRNCNYESDVKDKYSDDFVETEEAINQTKILNAKVKLHLSGTPYRILMGSEFKKEDIISFCQFSDIANEQENWIIENNLKKEEEQQDDWFNPYYGFPQMIRFAFNPSESAREKLKEYKKNGFTYAFSSLFKPVSIKKEVSGKHKKFVNENEILELFEVIDGSKNDENLLGFLNYDKIKEGKMCRHIVCVLPYCASCDALEKLILSNKNKFKNLSEYEIINISGVDNTTNYRTTNDVKTKIKECERNNKKTITLTVNRMLTGSTVEEWDTMLYFKDTASPQEYDQSIFRLQNQYIKEYIDEKGEIIKYNMKPQTLLVDFDPERMFVLQENKSLIYNVNSEESGNSILRERIANELKISPIITINKDKIVEITAEDIMSAVSNYSRSKGVLDETNEIPVDLTLLEYEAIRNVIEKQGELGSKKGLFIDNAEGDGEELDLPDSSSSEFTPEETEDETENDTDDSEGTSSADPIKQFRTYYARLLFFSFLTKDKVISLDDIIELIDEDDNSRIAHNLGLDKNILVLMRKNINLFILSQLDYKIQNINKLSNDKSIKPLDRAIIAVNKFSKLSESEYITPPRVCDEIISLISNREFENVINNNGKFLDIASKMGEFPIALYKKLVVELNTNTDLIKNNIYAIPTSSIAYEFTRKMYEILNLNLKNIACKFNAYDLLNIKKNNTNDLDTEKIVKLLSQNKDFNEIELEENIFTKEGGKNMKFDVIVGNPPYQISDGGALASARPIYQYFVEISNIISSRYTSLIIPTRWFVGGKGLDDFRAEMLNDTHIKELHDCLTPEDIFPNTNIRGGVCYFLRDNQYNNAKNLVKIVTHERNKIVHELERSLKINDYDVFIRDGKAKPIIDKIMSDINFESFSSYVSSRKPFGLDGNFAKKDKFKKNINGMKKPISCYAKGKKVGFVESSEVLNHEEWINRWKVFIPRANNIGTELSDDNMNSFVGKPNEICTESYLVVGAELDLNNKSAKNLEKYFKTKFLRYLHGLLKSSQDATSKTFELVPLQNFDSNLNIDWSKSIKEIDNQLYKKYGLTNEEIEYIESKIKEM